MILFQNATSNNDHRDILQKNEISASHTQDRAEVILLSSQLIIFCYSEIFKFLCLFIYFSWLCMGKEWLINDAINNFSREILKLKHYLYSVIVCFYLIEGYWYRDKLLWFLRWAKIRFTSAFRFYLLQCLFYFPDIHNRIHVTKVIFLAQCSNYNRL